MMVMFVVIILPVYAGNLKGILQADTENWHSYTKLLQNAQCILTKDSLLSPGTPLTVLTCSGATAPLYNKMLKLAHNITGPLLVDDLSQAPTNYIAWTRMFIESKMIGTSPHGYVFAVEDLRPEVLESCVQRIRLFDYVWNHRAKFTVISFKYVKRSTRDAVLKIFSDYDVVNPVILCPSGNSQAVYRKSPYVPQNYPWLKFTLMEYCNGGHHFDAIKDLNGKKFHVALEDYRPQSFISHGRGRGYDFMLLEVILHLLNASEPSCTKQYLGTRLPNGSVIGAIGDVVEGRADFLGTHFFPSPAFWDLFTDTRYLAQDDLHMIVRKAPLAPPSTVVFYAFDSVTWWLLLYTIISSVIFLFGMRRDIGVGLQAIRIFLTGSASPTFIKQSLPSQKTLFIFSAFFSLVVLNSFQGSIVSLLASPRYLPDLNTVEEVYQMSTVIFAPLPQLNTLRTSADDQDLINRLISKCEDTQSFETYLNSLIRLAKGKGMAAVMSYGGAYVFKRIPGLSHDGLPLLYIVPEPLMAPAFRMVSLRRTSPLIGAFNKFIPRLIQSGIYNHWINQLLVELTSNGFLVHITEKHTHKPTESLGTDYFQGAFNSLICGLVAGNCVFIVEMIIPLLKQYKRI